MLTTDKASPQQSGQCRSIRREVGIFLVCASAWAGAVTLLMLEALPDGFPRGDRAVVDDALAGLTMLYGFGPMAAAIVTSGLVLGGAGVGALFARITIWRVSPWWFGAALVVPVVPQWIGLLVWSQLTGVPWTAPAPGAYLASWLQITLIGALYFVSEELGWRGFLLPRMLLQQHWLAAAVTVGLIWAVWHYPYWTLSSWAMAESWEAIALSLLVSSGRAVALSVIMTWIFQRTSGSVLLAMLFHGSNNANFAKMFDAAGDAALSGPGFLAAQAASAMALAVLLAAALWIRSGADRASASR